MYTATDYDYKKLINKGIFMKKLLLSLVFILSFPANSYADSGVRDSLERMFELTDMQAMIDSSHAQINQMFSQMAKEQNISDEQKVIFEKHRKKLQRMLVESLSWDKIKEPIIEAYSQVYTKAEIDELIVFYESPLGQKMIKKMPELMQVSMQVMQETSMSLIPQMQALQEEFQRELREQEEI